ncbi:MAG: DUF1385 domain-containing protein [Negativicutes bacterium]|jgi:uncharacterized protein YqhQ
MAKPFIGGQAVIEGVMMRGPDCIATAVRQPDGTIIFEKNDFNPIIEKYPLLRKPLLRGVISLVESLVYGIKALSYSAQAAGEEEAKLSKKEIVSTMLIAFGLAIVLFIVIPTYAAKFLKMISANPIWLNISEGILRLAIFLAYIGAISQMKDIRRVFSYHGAEHKTIHAFEAGLELTVENVRPQSPLHPRCGTNFLLIVMVISIFAFAAFGWPSLLERILTRVLLMPVIAGVSYEAIRWAIRSKSTFVAKLMLPGLMLQKLTTREPDDSMLEVAIVSAKAVIPSVEEGDGQEFQ